MAKEILFVCASCRHPNNGYDQCCLSTMKRTTMMTTTAATQSKMTDQTNERKTKRQNRQKEKINYNEDNRHREWLGSNRVIFVFILCFVFWFLSFLATFWPKRFHIENHSIRTVRLLSLSNFVSFSVSFFPFFVSFARTAYASTLRWSTGDVFTLSVSWSRHHCYRHYRKTEKKKPSRQTRNTTKTTKQKQQKFWSSCFTRFLFDSTATN